MLSMQGCGVVVPQTAQVGLGECSTQSWFVLMCSSIFYRMWLEDLGCWRGNLCWSNCPGGNVSNPCQLWSHCREQDMICVSLSYIGGVHLMKPGQYHGSASKTCPWASSHPLWPARDGSCRLTEHKRSPNKLRGLILLLNNIRFDNQKLWPIFVPVIDFYSTA